MIFIKTQIGMVNADSIVRFFIPPEGGNMGVEIFGRAETTTCRKREVYKLGLGAQDFNQKVGDFGWPEPPVRSLD